MGCIFGELLFLKPIFKGEEARIEPNKLVPFQKHQMTKIMEVLGPPRGILSIVN
jgi:cyclin-dependent kinase 8/11